MPDLSIEESVSGVVAGIDEAGRGPWAGPVVAAAVILDRNNIPEGINDSKKLSAKKRVKIFEQLIKKAEIGIGIANVEEIDNLNILNATKLAMERAYRQLRLKPKTTLIDGNSAPLLPCETITVIKGDSKSLSIAAASIIAKVTRDKIMEEIDKNYPHYGWKNNAGYGTKQHQDAITQFGICKHHRKSFRPVAEILENAAAA